MTQHVNGLIEKAWEGTLWRPGTWERLDLGEVLTVRDCLREVDNEQEQKAVRQEMVEELKMRWQTPKTRLSSLCRQTICLSSTLEVKLLPHTLEVTLSLGCQ